jgi:hypothetical protein
MELKKSVFLVFVILLIPFVLAGEIFIAPASLSVTQGQNFIVEVRGNVYESISDVYGVQFTVNFDPALLSVNLVLEGDLLNNDSTDPTIFNYSVGSGTIRIYNLRNSSTGIYKNGTFSIITFSTIASGTSSVNLSSVIWTNSTITNMSVGISNVNVSNSSVVVNPVPVTPPTTDSGSGGGGGGGGGSGTGSVIFNITNNTINGSTTSGEVPTSENEGAGAENPTEGNGEETQGGLFRLTGNVINSFTSGRIFKSWAFYFVAGLIFIFGVVLLLRKFKIGSKQVSKY